jgi:DNA-binding PadR family transcriptional regulator
MTRQAMNYLLGQMEQLGYLTRDDDPQDQRFKRVHLTERGHAAARAIRHSVAQIEAELERELGPAQFDQLRQLLIQLNATSLVRQLPTTTRNDRPTKSGRLDRARPRAQIPRPRARPSTKASASTDAAPASAKATIRRSAP